MSGIHRIFIERTENMPKNKNVNVKKLTMSAVMVALSAALSLVKIFEMPLGGSVTLLSMVPFSAGDLRPQRWQAVSHSITS